ncbi:MAG: glycosyltransferase family 2 protein [Chitinophagales bacterium]|nr:glycosyltransferase family 2 protein [Chitinophagales bacterium]MDW8417814.1 glycosyltransferase family 2 protein [Chitinophagales bacterium]
MNYSFIIFCYNEEHNLIRVYERLKAFCSRSHSEHEIIIVDDGSTDGTPDICKKLKEENPGIIVITHAVNAGIGLALRSGYEAATREYVCAIPGDGQFDIEELNAVRPFTKETFYSFYRPQTNYNSYRKLLTWLNRLFNQHILGLYLRDVNWVKVYRREHLMITAPVLRSSLIESEICAKLNRMGIMPIEIPSVYHPRQSGKAKGGSWNTLRKALAETLKLWWLVVTFKPRK